MSQSPPEMSSGVGALEALLHPTGEFASAEERLLWRCARVRVDAGDLAEIARIGADLDQTGWERVVALAQANGVENLLFTHIASAGLLDQVPGALVGRMRQWYGEVAIYTRRLEVALARVLSLLQAANAPVIVVKGLALTRRLYGEIALRPISDIDLIAQAKDMPRWTEALRAAGFAPAAGKSERLGRHVLRFREMQFHDAKGLMLETHVEVCRYPAYQRAFAARAIWSAARPLGGPYSWGLGLDPRDELSFLCMHYAVQHRIGRLIWLTDVAEIARRIPDARAWGALVEHVVSRRVAAPVAVTLARARALLDAPVPDAALERLRGAALTPAERRAWDAANREMSGLRWYLSQMTVARAPLERATLLWNGASALARRGKRQIRRQEPEADHAG